MYALIQLAGTTEPTLRMTMLGTYEELSEARESMFASVSGVVLTLAEETDFIAGVDIDFERKVVDTSAHVFYGDAFWQWVIFDSDKPSEWNSLRYW